MPLNPETLLAMKEACERARKHQWRDHALGIMIYPGFLEVVTPANVSALIAERDELEAEVERQAREIEELRRGLT